MTRSGTTMVCVCACVGAFLAACSSSAKSSSPTVLSSTTVGSTVAIHPNRAAAALLSAAELPATFRDIGWYPAHGSEALPSCAKSRRDRTVDVTVPPLVLVGRRARDSRGVAQYTEELRTYANAGTATVAYKAMRNGETCSNGDLFRLDGTKTATRIESPRDVTATVGADGATAFVEHTPGFDDRLVVALLGNVLVRFDFNTVPGANAAYLGDPLSTVKSGIAKVKQS